MSEHLTLYNFLRCSNCGNKLIFADVRLVCSNCNSSYRVNDFVPDMLPFRLNSISDLTDKLSVKKTVPTSTIEESLTNDESWRRFPIAKHELKEAEIWLSKKLGVSSEDVRWGKNDLFRSQLAFTLKSSRENDLSRDEKEILVEMLGARNMSFKYKSRIADQLSASGEASAYEAYEDILLRAQVDKAIAEKGDIAIIEIGSGVGRLLHQYGTCMTRNLSPNGARYRRFANLFYDYVEKYDKHIKLLIGLDFERRMINKALVWLRRSGLTPLIEEYRIVQLRALATKLNIETDPKITKIVTILFQTLGNQLGEEQKISLLKKAKEFASPNGIVFVSVFNKQSFSQQAYRYYDSIRESVGRIAYCQDGVFLSDKGVFSVWFEIEELRDLFRKAGFSNVTILEGKDLETFQNYDRYIDISEQSRYKERAIIAIAQV